jgi:hypothetical protein
MSATLEQMRIERRRSLRWMDQASGTAMVMWALAGAAAVVGLVLALQTAVSGEPFPASWYRNLTLAVWCTLLPIPGMAWAALQAQRQVWLARVAPAQGIRVATRAFWRTLGVSFAVAVLPLIGVALLAPPSGGSGAFALFVTGLMAGTLTAVVIVSAAWRGELPALWILPGLAALAAMILKLIPEQHMWLWQAADGFRFDALLAMAMSPAAAVLLLWPALGVRSRARPLAPAPALRTLAKQQFRSLTERLRYVDGASSIGVLGGLWGQLPQQFINRQPEGLLFMPWGSTFTSAGPWRLLALTLVAGALLSTPALHWRHLLAPRGALRASLGWKIWLTTYLMVASVLTAVLAPIGLGVLLLASDGPQLWPQVPGLLLSYLPPLMLDLALATALATLIRGWAGTQGKAMATLGVLALLWGLVHLLTFAWTGQGALPLRQRDEGYALLIVTAAGCCAWAAARVWRRADLGALMRSSRSKRGGADHDR